MRRAMAVAAGLFLACGGREDSPGHWEGTPGDSSGLDGGGARPWPSGSSSPPPTGGAEGGADGAAPHGDPCTANGAAPGDRAMNVAVGAETRTLVLHVPRGYDPTRRTPLVVAFHGFLMTPDQLEGVSDLKATSDAHGFLVAFPAGVGTSWNAGDCCGQATAANEDDIGFFKNALAQIEGGFCVDTKRVYAAGFSNGGFFSHRLACELGDVVAAIMPVSGVLGMPPASCAPRRPIPILEFHGTGDIVVPYDGGTPIVPGFGSVKFRSVADTIQAWRANDRCLDAGNVVYQQGDATCVNYGGCADGAEVELCTIQDGGHAWPGGHGLGFPGEGKVSTSISASERMAAFFARHALP